MELLTLFQPSPTLRLSLACVLLGSSCLAILRIGIALGIVKMRKSPSRVIDNNVLQPKSGTFSKKQALIPSTLSGTDKPDRAKLGAAKISGIAVLASVIVISLASGFTGSKIENVAEASKPKTKPDPYITIGCIQKDTTKCRPEDMVKVLEIVGRRVHFQHENKAELSPDFWIKMCDDQPKKLPFDPGDVLIYFVYEDRLDEQCSALGPHWGVAMRRIGGLTDSEREAANVRFRSSAASSLPSLLHIPRPD